MGYLGRPDTPFWSGHLGRPGTKIGPWAGPGPSAKHEARGCPARWHDGLNLARHDRAGPGRAARLLIYTSHWAHMAYYRPDLIAVLPSLTVG